MELQRKEHREVLQQMQLSQAKLHEHYENIRNSTERLKFSFENVKRQENETELLRQKYYDMLTTKTYSEEDRDDYFQLEQTTRDIKDMYVAESQKLAHKCSTYVVFSYRHSGDREQFLTKMLQEADKYYVDCENMKRERTKMNSHCANLQNELQKCESSNMSLEESLRQTQDEKDSLQRKCDEFLSQQTELLTEKGNLERENSNLDSTLSDTRMKNENLSTDLTQSKNEGERLRTELESCNQNIAQLKRDVEDRKNDQKNLNEKITYHLANTKELETQLHGYKTKTNNLTTELKKGKEELARLQKQKDALQEATKQARKDRNKMKESYEKMRKDKDTMEDQLNNMRHEREMVGKEKDRLVSREYRVKIRNKELTEDHKFLTKEVDDLREKYRRADERAKKDGSLKQELRDTIKRLHKEMEEERKRMIKVTRDVRIQTDPGLACESRDIAIQHAQFKMKQALRARDQQVVENKRLKEIQERTQKALDKKTNELGTFETKLKASHESRQKLEEKCKRFEKLLLTSKQELEKEKKKLEKTVKDEQSRVVLVEQVRLTDSSDAECQTVDELLVNAKEAELTLNLALCLQEKVNANKVEMAERQNELERSNFKIAKLEKSLQQQKMENETLQRKIIYMEARFFEERTYMKEIHNALKPKNLQPSKMESLGFA